MKQGTPFLFDKDINILLRGANGVEPGKVVSVSNDALIVSNRWSSKYHYAIEEIQAFWYDEDKPEE